jgi:S-adenosylmethionine/arginine decarboxylase-like enzyme
VADRRLIRLDFRDRVQDVWDESVPIIRQNVLEGVGVSPEHLGDKEFLLAAADKLCSALSLEIVERYVHEFAIDSEGSGFTVVVLLSESHLAMHTWPERRYVHVDLVTCKKVSKSALDELSQTFVDTFTPSHVRGFSAKY